MSQLGAKVLCQGDWWTPGSVVSPPNAGGRSFTFITRHQLPDGQPAPRTEPAEVVAALERLELRPLTTTVVAAPNASGGGAAEREAVELEVVDLGPKGCGLVPLRDLAAGDPARLQPLDGASSNTGTCTVYDIHTTAVVRVAGLLPVLW